MGRIGLPELIVVLVIVLVLFGASRIPAIMGSLGRGLKEFKKAVGDAPVKKTKAPRKQPAADRS